MPSLASLPQAGGEVDPAARPARHLQAAERPHVSSGPAAATTQVGAGPGEHAPVGFEPAIRVEHDAHRRALLEPRQPASELGVVRLDRAAADHDRVEARAQRLHVAARDLAGDRYLPLPCPADRIVGGDSELQHGIRPAFGHLRQMPGMRPPRLLREHAGDHLDAGGLEPLEPPPRHARIRVGKRRHDAAQSQPR